MARGLLKLLGALFAVVGSAALGFVVGVSPIGVGVFVALGGTPYDGWEALVTGPLFALLGALLSGIGLVVRSVRAWDRDVEEV
jgi:hypothetical protein